MIPLVWLTLLAASPVPDPCAMITKSEAQVLIGEPVASTSKEPPEPDEDTGAIQTSCTFMGKTKALVIAVLEFKSAAEATKAITAEFLKSQDEEAAPNIVDESGLGDRAYFSHTPRAAMMLARKGARAYVATVGGKLTAAGASYRGRLHTLVAAMAAKG
ncbi:MAG: hypothetical protein ACKVZ0_09670 [Gemmatimonadales bacterium]